MRPTRSSSIVAVVVLALAGTALFAGGAGAQSRAPTDVSVRIWPLARITPDGGIAFRVFVRCGPLAGAPDFRQAFAGASQPRMRRRGRGRSQSGRRVRRRQARLHRHRLVDDRHAVPPRVRDRQHDGERVQRSGRRPGLRQRLGQPTRPRSGAGGTPYDLEP